MARTLSKTAHQSIIHAFVELMKKEPIENITTDAIARAAGASKGTLYKHWANKEVLLLEVVGEFLASQPVAHSGNFREDTVSVLKNMFVRDARGPFGRIWPNIFSYSIMHPKFCRAVSEVLVERAPSGSLISILRAASREGQLRSDIDLNFALDLLAGPLMHHRMLHGSVPPALPARAVAAVWPLLAV
jgi:AcrR family transcriptional regulator